MKHSMKLEGGKKWSIEERSLIKGLKLCSCREGLCTETRLVADANPPSCVKMCAECALVFDLWSEREMMNN